MKIHVTGVSGTGKTSIAGALMARGINAIDLDEISHWENKKTGEVTEWEAGSSDEWMESHAWICDIPQLKERMAISENCVVLGHTSNHDEYLSFFDKIFVLHCSPETIVARIQARTNNDFGKHPLEEARILNWQKEFTNWMVEKGASVINCEKPLEEVVQEIESYLG